MLNEMVLSSAEQLHALGHPLRQQILSLLGDQAQTNRQLAAKLGESPARLHFHVRGLARAGLIELVEQRAKGGVVEKYYRASARNYRLGPSIAVADLKSAEDSIRVAADRELSRAFIYFGGPPTGLRIVRHHGQLSPEALRRVRSHLHAIDEEFLEGPGGSTQGTSGQLVALTYMLHPLAPSDGSLEGMEDAGPASPGSEES